jgi:anaerobic nitric oxide reductase transcription regulator
LSACAERPRILSIDSQALDLPQRAGAVEPMPLVLPEAAATMPLREALDAYQKQLIGAALQRHQHKWADTARELGVDRANLIRLARRLGLK